MGPDRALLLSGREKFFHVLIIFFHDVIFYFDDVIIFPAPGQRQGPALNMKCRNTKVPFYNQQRWYNIFSCILQNTTLCFSPR